MQKRSMVHAWRVALAAAALIATLMALYVQLFERRSRQEEDRLVASRLVAALEESRARLKAELLAELRAELAKTPGPAGDQPLPGAVLRRSESSEGRVLQQVLASENAEDAVLEERLDGLAGRIDQTDRVMLRNLEEIRAEVRREQNVTAKTVSLLLAALLSLVAYLVTSLLTEGKRQEG